MPMQNTGCRNMTGLQGPLLPKRLVRLCVVRPGSSPPKPRFGRLLPTSAYTTSPFMSMTNPQVDVDEQHPVGRTVLNGTVETNDPAGWIASIQDSSPAEHTNITVGNFIVDCTVGDGVVSVTATGPADQVHTLEQRLAAVRW